MSLYFGSRIFFLEELFAFDVHFELGLYLECGGVVSSPSFFTLIGSKIIDFLDSSDESASLCGKFH